jgi:GT2 family glycosyltransferase
LNYNDEDNVIRLLSELINIDIKDIVKKVIVVNNSGENEKSELLKKAINYNNNKNQYNLIDYIENKINSGYYKGNLIGVRTLKEKYFIDKALILNPDVGSLNWEYSIKRMYDKSLEENIFIVGGRVIIPGHKDVSSPILVFSPLIETLRNFFFPFSYLIYKKKQRKLSMNSGDVFAVEGSAYLVDSNKFISTESYFEDIFLFGEEIMFGLIARKNQWKIYFDNKVEIVHFHLPKKKNRTYDIYYKKSIEVILNTFFNGKLTKYITIISLEYKTFIKNVLIGILN